MSSETRSDNTFLATRCYDVTVSLHDRQVPEFDQLLTIGMAVRLALHLRGVGQAVPYNLLKQVGLYILRIPPTSLTSVVDLLAEAEFVKVNRQGGTTRAIVPTVPYYDDFLQQMNEVAGNRHLSEPERLTIDLVSRLAKSPAAKETLVNGTGAPTKLIDRMIRVGTDGGYFINRRARGRDMVLSPLYFPENADAFADLAARSGSGRVGKVVSTLARNQGWPLRLIQERKAVGDTPLSAEELQVVAALAGEGFTPPPAICTAHAGENHFLFAPKPGVQCLAATKRPIYEAAMALVAAVRQGHLLPRQVKIHYPKALLRALRENKSLRANSEAMEQYRELVVLRVGRLVPDGSFHRFELIETPENQEALDLAIRLLAGTEPMPAVSEEVTLAFQKGEDYLDSLVGRQRLVQQTPVPADEQVRREIDDFLLRGAM